MPRSHSFWFELSRPVIYLQVEVGSQSCPQYRGIHASLQRLQWRRLAERATSKAVTTDRTARSLRLGFWYTRYLTERRRCFGKRRFESLRTPVTWVARRPLQSPYLELCKLSWSSTMT